MYHCIQSYIIIDKHNLKGSHDILGQVEDTIEEAQEDQNFYHILEGPTYNETFPTHEEEEENVHYILEDND